MENTYQDGDNYVCADCAHEWSMVAKGEAEEAAEPIKDANGNVLQNGDTVILVKDLKVKGSSITLKQGVKIKNIRLASGDHAVECRIDGGSFMLKQSFLKKV